MTSEQVAFWSMVASSASAIAAAVAALFSYLAINSWKKQEKLKARQEFKKAVFHYLDISRRLPHRAFPQDRQDQKEEFNAFRQAKNACAYAWTIAEGQIENPKIHDLWERLNDAHHEYLVIRKNITDVQDIASEIIETNFIY